MNAFVSLLSSCACAWPVRTWVSLGRIPRISAKSCAVGTLDLDATAISSSLPGFAEQALCGRKVESGQCGASDCPDRPELDDAGEPELLDRTDGLHPDGLADREVLLVRSRFVDDDLVAFRPAPFDQTQWIERRGAARDAEAEVGRAAVHDRLPVLADQLRLSVDAAVSDGDGGKRAHLLRGAPGRMSAR